MKKQSSHVKLDKTDRKILDILQSNAKITNSQLSKNIGLSPAPTLERVKKLEVSGVIENYHAKVNGHKVGVGIQTFVQVSLRGHNKELIDTFIREINVIQEIVECHQITGSSDFILRVVSVDIQSYQKLILEKISKIEMISGLKSMIILHTYKESSMIPMSENG